MFNKILKHKIKLFYLNLRILKSKITIKFWRTLAWILKKYIFIRNKIMYLCYKLTTYNTDKIWQTCGQKCDCWPGTYDYDNGICTKCEMWNKFSPRIKLQLEKECIAYTNHCLTGE